MAILGGSKVSDKISVIENLLAKADKVLIGGGYDLHILQSSKVSKSGNSLVKKINLMLLKLFLKNQTVN